MDQTLKEAVISLRLGGEQLPLLRQYSFGEQPPIGSS